MATKNNTAKTVGVAALATAAVASIAGAVFLYGTDAGKKKRKQIRSWAIKAKGEVLEKLEKAKEVNETVYNDIVKKVMAKYEKVKDIDMKDFTELAKDLSAGWKHIKRELNIGKTAVKKTVKKVSKPKAAKASN
jgi:hypothetical protein